MPGGIEMKESMEMELTPKFANKKIFEGEGGSYHSWSATEFPFLAQAKVGAGILVLKPGGFALPHYADSSKVGYVLQGENGVTGMV
ncbi:Glutelin type-A [Melia azedarach]|uniref:Glutelin type-A n=1 Tax=Melia azedarach TaxID=155640 RepID=A0ACC1Y113_MELAZ|nr:Glutelin type-A [Melia azedarach]